MKTDTRKLLREAAGDEEQSSSKVKAQYDRIQRLLGDNIFNHSEIIDKLWGKGKKDDASQRSLFRKKLNREEYQGTKYEFNEEELIKIAQIMMDTSSVIRKNLGKRAEE
jgi:hypothetical protein